MALQFGAITFDCLDVIRMATFWSAVTGIAIDEGASEYFATLGRETAQPAWFFLHVDERSSAKNPIHVDLVADADREGEVERLVGLGAERGANFDEGGFSWVTLRDPEGNLFDVASGH